MRLVCVCCGLWGATGLLKFVIKLAVWSLVSLHICAKHISTLHSYRVGEGEMSPAVFRRRVLKVVPVWLILLVATSGIAAAAFVWISNQIHTTVTLSNAPLAITGTFASTQFVGLMKESDFTYTVSAGSPTGYLQLTFATSGTFSGESDCQVTVSFFPAEGSPGTLGPAATTLVSSNQIIMLLGAPTSTVGTPVPIQFGSTTGELKLFVTYTNAASKGTVNAYLQVTSTSS